ncbi:hypothetical protein O3V59_08585 [Brevibacillus thermoruber]|uniref:Uncharacterized protein n=1 Tax=Brevibacillus thermoruber TaxID=33942 RepID=A0A9X3TPJ3_9BACL|nr:hypothetical protein [Brevibacillus thermoruber]MDA5108416.1 hypothetical protein [Brevibacillus thermoruber]
MQAVGKLIFSLFTILLGLGLLGSIIYQGFGPSIQQQANDQGNQISSMRNNPMEGTVDIRAITGTEDESRADTWK